VSGADWSFLPEKVWTARRRADHRRSHDLLQPHAVRRSHGLAHPVYDFLFEYYSFRPGHLKRWTPGVGRVLQGASAGELPQEPYFEKVGEGVRVSLSGWNPERTESLVWVIGLLEATAKRAPRFSCYGLHEWAMVYRQEELRHPSWPLRMEPEALARFVESQAMACSHFDAFRFFTPEARPLNSLQPDRGNRLQLEQRGCLHANMDLYKWAYKFWPWIESSLVLDGFALALEVRELDMRASPYDFQELGFKPVPVETAEGREDYERQQKLFAEKAEPLRARLITELKRLYQHVGQEVCDGLVSAGS
jgi:hypothetical protein